MKDLKSFMKIGIIHSMAFPSSSQDMEGFIKSINIIAKDDYFDVLEIGQIKDDEVRKVVKGIVEESKLVLSYSGHSRLLFNGLNINDLREEGRIKAVEALKEGIDEAYYMGAESFAFLSGRYDEESKEQAFLALLKSTRELCDYAKLKGDMPVLIEIFDYDIDKRSLLGPIKLVERFTKEVGEEHGNFGLMVDLSHLPMLRETPRQAILPVSKYIKHVHIGNTVIKDSSFEAYGDLHPRFGFPNSENDAEELVEFLKVLIEVGYLNTSNPPIVSFEVKPRPYEDEEVIIAGSKRVLREAWLKVE